MAINENSVLFETDDDLNETTLGLLVRLFAKADSSGFVYQGLNTTADHANNNYSVGSGRAVIVDGDRGYMGSSPGVQGASLPTSSGLNIVEAIYHPDTSNDDLEIRARASSASAPTDPHLKLAEIDTLNDQPADEFNRQKDEIFGALTALNSFTDPAGTTHTGGLAAAGHNHPSISPDAIYSRSRTATLIMRKNSGGTIHVDGPGGSVASGSNATSVCQSAANWLGNNGGGELYIVPGEYSFDGQVNLKANTTVSGEHGATVINQTANDTPVFVDHGYNGVVIQNLKIVSSGSSYTAGVGAIRIADADATGESQENCLVQNVTVDGGQFSGITIGINSTKCRVLNCTVSGVAEHGIYFSNTTGDCLASGNIIQNVGVTGIKLSGTAGIDVVNNRINSPGSSGITLDDGASAKLSGNTIDSPSGSGIYIRSDNIAVDGDVIRSPGNRGVFCRPQSGTMSGVSLTGVRVDQPQYSGIYLLDCYNSNITDCRIMNYGQAGTSTSPSYHGVRISGDSDRNTLSDLQIRAGASSKNGVIIQDSTCDRTWIDGCDLRMSGNAAAISDSGTGTVTTDNQTSTL